jgi:DNA-binding MarR family transcriptional regulator/ribosomal protein S18 acetylase RimI-like enzyme
MPDPYVGAIRSFNRFYTRQIGVLSDRHLDSPFSLTEVRVLYELAHRDQPTASEIARDLGLDAGYLSRILMKFRKQRLLAGQRSATDARQTHLSLTELGRKTFAPLDHGANHEISAFLRPLADADRVRLVESMRNIQRILSPTAVEPEVALRPHGPGDIGWVVFRHGVLYAREYGWGAPFEALVAKIAGEFLEHFDPARERCWIAERGGERVGSVFLVRQTDEIAKLRLLLVEPSARGLGLGKRLVGECVAFARQAGYRTITLWTQAELAAARRIYENAGFRLSHTEKHRHFGREAVGEIWELTL